MKILVLILGVLGFMATAQANLTEDCLNITKSWVYSNTSRGSSDSAQMALEFCSVGGNYTCLTDAKNWAYSNTSRGSSDSAEAAINFCKHGEVSCLTPAKNWIYSNTSAGSSDSAEQALDLCGKPKSCQQN